MHKSKDGKIIASLTEVKNKTGDIFSLVDEFGEVTLTSYNKPKYKISKIDVFSSLEVRGDNDKKEEKEPAKAPVETKAPEKKEVEVSPKVEKAESTSSLISVDVLKKLKGLITWDRHSRLEKAFISNVVKPLQ
jgi:hypothetical protein